MTEIPREERLLNLLSVLLAARTPVPFPEIKDTVAGYDDLASAEALDKRFDRDKADLRKLGVPLEYVKEDDFGRSGYRIAKERFFLSEVRFDVEEGIVLAALHRSVTASGPLAGRLRSALTKISVDSPLSEALRDSAGEMQLPDARVAEAEGGKDETLTTLGEALSSRRRVRFSYYTLGTGRTSVRTVEPYGIGYFGGHWYLVGRDVKKDGVRVFRASRIRSRVEPLKAGTYEIPGDFDLKQRLGRAPWSLKEGPATTARIRFDPDVAWMIAENLRDGQSFEPARDGSGTLVTTFTDPDALVRWVAGYGPSAEVVEPRELREALVTHLETLLGRYAS